MFLRGFKHQIIVYETYTLYSFITLNSVPGYPELPPRASFLKAGGTWVAGLESAVCVF